MGTDLTFAAFHRAHAPAVWELALRHAGDRATAQACVDAVFAEVADHWGRIADPARFVRRAAVLYVCRSRRRTGGCRPTTRRSAVTADGSTTVHRRRTVAAA